MKPPAPESSLRRLSPVLVANRGEIAVRVQRTVRELGLRGAAIFSEADRRSPHALGADIAVRVGGYLDPEEVVAAARRAGARAVHPGYGFLSENAGFARAVLDAGLVWVGPPPEAIELMGDKGRSKELAREAEVPVVPGTTGADAGAEEVEAFAAEHGYPIVIKALAGGGGKGMRVVAEADGLEPAIASARREAKAAFGDERILAERYLERPRHIEIQVLADSQGGIVHLGERECSLQRRHQKVIEEAPSPLVEEAMRERMGAAAIALARACGYEGAGTVEFIVPADGSDFFFLEMNTRLQVEHPVTELVWGVDLVAEQLRVAAGASLRLSQQELSPAGHAIEARLYAEDPAAGFLPAAGTIRRWREPELSGVRIDAGVAEGSVVGTDYDPMLAKVIAHGPDRETALGRLDRALAELELLGVATNAAFSRALLALDAVVDGRLDTGLLERELETAGEALAPRADLGAAAAAVLYRIDTADLGVPAGPWRRRLDPIGAVAIRDGTLTWDDGSADLAAELEDGSIAVELDGVRRIYCWATSADGETVWVGRDGHQLEVRVARRLHEATVESGSLEAPMPGKVLTVAAANGQRVSEGEVLLVLESMKMELQITAPRDGVVGGLDLAVGDQVAQGDALVVVGEADPEGEG